MLDETDIATVEKAPRRASSAAGSDSKSRTATGSSTPRPATAAKALSAAKPASAPSTSDVSRNGESLSRSADYKMFRANAKSVFSGPIADPGHLRMSDFSGFHVSMTEPEDLAPSAADAVVEVFYGPREHAGLASVASDAAKRQWRSPVETGAALLYSRGEDGVVTVFLYPAQTDRGLAAEDAIVLARYTDLAPLTGRGTLEEHWRAFRAYAETTSLDGQPRFRDRLMVRWLRFTRPRIVDNRRQPIAAVTAALQIAAGGVALAIAAVLLGVR